MYCHRKFRIFRHTKLVQFISIIAVYLTLDRFVFEHGPRTNNRDSFMGDLSVSGVSDVNHIDANVSCKRPALPLWPPEILVAFRIHEKPVCNRGDWIFVKNATFYIRKQHGSSISCTYHPVSFATDFGYSLGEGRPVANGTPMVSDFFEVECKTPWSWSTHHQVYAGITRKIPRLQQNPPWPKFGFPMNILILGFHVAVKSYPKSAGHVSSFCERVERCSVGGV